MKLAKRLGAVTLASVMAVTAVPTAVMANEVTEVATVEAAVEEVVEEVSEETVVEEAPVQEVVVENEEVALEEVIEAQDTRAEMTLVDQQEVAERVEKLNNKLSEVREFTNQYDETVSYKTWVALKEKVEDADLLLACKYDAGVASSFKGEQMNSNRDGKEPATYDVNEYKVKLETAVTDIDNANKYLVKLKPLEDLVTEAEKLNKDDYKGLDAAIVAAKDALADLKTNNNSTTDLDTEVSALQTAMASKSELKQMQEAIAEAEKMLSNSKNYGAKTLADVRDALAVAKAIEGTPTSAQISALTTPINAVASIKEIQIELDKANALNPKDYTAASWADFKVIVKTQQDLVDKAGDVNTDTLTKATATAAAQAMADAMDVINTASAAKPLISVVDFKKVYEEAKAAVKDLKSENYTTTSWNAMQTALGAANTLATQVEQPNSVAKTTIDQAITDLYAHVFGKTDATTPGKYTDEDPTNGLVDISELKKLIAEGKKTQPGDYANSNNEYTTYINAVNTAETKLTNDKITKDGTGTDEVTVKSQIEAIKNAKKALVPISKNDFNKLIKKAEELVANRNYFYGATAADVEALKTAITTAKAVTTVSEADVTSLQSAINTFKGKNNHGTALSTALSAAETYLDTKDLMSSDKAELEAAIAEAKSLLSTYSMDVDKIEAATNKLTITNYKEKAYASLTDLITNAGQIVSTDMSDAAYIALKKEIIEANKVQSTDSADKIEEAYEKLKVAMSKTNANKEGLQALYDSVAKYGLERFTCAAGDSEWTTFDNARTAAKTALNGNDSVAIKSAYNNLNDALTALNKLAVNKTTLAEQIAKIEEKALIEEDYKVDAWKDFQKAMDKAKELVAGTEEVSLEIKNAANDLKTKEAALATNPYEVDQAALGTLLGSANALLDKKDTYTEASFKAFTDQLAIFKAKLCDSTGISATKVTNARPSDVRATEKALVEAMDKLEELGIDALDKMIAKAEALKEADYTAESWKAFTTVLTNAKTASQEGTAVEIREATVALEKAMNELVKKPLPTPADYITNLYEIVMGRKPSDEEVAGYNNGQWTGAQLVEHFVGSKEFEDKKLSDEDYIKTLYKLALGREANEADLAYWKGELDKSTRKIILSMMLGEDEFNKYCASTGMTTGSVEITPADQLEKYPTELSSFVNRLYSTCLGRTPQAIETLGWADKLAAKEMKGSEIATFFMNSDEFVGKDTTDAEFVHSLYTAFFGVDNDTAGEEYWKGELTSGKLDRATILACFVGSEQFKGICDAAGIER